MRIHLDELQDAAATPADIKRYRADLESAPVRCGDGLEFDADAQSLQRMSEIADALQGAEEVRWRLADNTETLITADKLRLYVAEIKRVRAERLLAVFQEYRALRDNPAATLRDLENWKALHLSPPPNDEH